MKLTLLIDLDDTLIENNIETFLPQYIRAFQGEVASLIDPQKFVKALMRGTEKMVNNLRPDRTLKEVFDASFYSELGIREVDFKAIAEIFYSQVFPSLSYLTQPRQEAVSLVDTAFASDYRLAIATNPLFPLTAVLQRLKWANLPIEKYNFELVSSFETFHYAKPNPAFFAEVLARMGWPGGAVVVVGDDLERDIDAGRQLGVLAYWVSNNSKDALPSVKTPSGSGGLHELIPWLEGLPEESLHPDYSSQSALIAILRATPAAWDSICRDIPSERLTQQHQKDEWSITEIICHMRDIEREVNLPRLNKGIREDIPFLAGENTDSWALERNYIQQDDKQALQDFIKSRMELLDVILDFEPQDWERKVRHSIFGLTNLSELVKIITIHDRLHLNQVHQIISALSSYE